MPEYEPMRFKFLCDTWTENLKQPKECGMRETITVDRKIHDQFVGKRREELECELRRYVECESYRVTSIINDMKSFISFFESKEEIVRKIRECDQMLDSCCDDDDEECDDE